MKSDFFSSFNEINSGTELLENYILILRMLKARVELWYNLQRLRNVHLYWETL